jgi:excisionase family DNA binding protein
MASQRGVTPGNGRSPLSFRSDELEEMLTAKELELLLKISAKILYRYVQRGLIPYVRIQSNVRFPKKQILEWIACQSYRP